MPVRASRQRLTMLVGANMDGSEKLDLLIIGKYANQLHRLRNLIEQSLVAAKQWENVTEYFS